MKPLFVLLFFWLGLNQGNTQNWNTIQQASLGVAYDLPQAWYVGGHTHQKNCDCLGSAVNSSPEGALSMLLVVGESTDPAWLQQPVWGYEYISADPSTSTISLEQLSFEQSISTWKQSPREIVLRFVGIEPNSQRTYVLYFWGSLGAIQQYNETIERIMHSLELL